MSTDTFIRAHYAEILYQLAVDKGCSGDALLDAAGLPPRLLRDPDNHLRLDEFERLVRAALDMTGDPALGLHFGERLKFTTHGALSQAAVSSANIEEALQLLIKYYKIRFSSIDLRFFIEGEDAVIELDERVGLGDLRPFLIEALFVSVMDVNSLLFGLKLLYGGSCRISYPEPAYGDEYRRHFYDALTFDTGVNQLRFRKDNLALPMALANPVAKRLAEQQCEEELRSLGARESILIRVRRLLENSGDTLPTMETVAQRLFTTPRTLRRQLQQHDTSFQNLLAEVRLTRAQRMLRQGRRSVDEIAQALGYTDPSNFGRAFRKWTGLSPSAYRAQNGPAD
ncbi:AraC family transcriptional regulator [Mangrovitalea sediminis]|uniref:AraC family transcriptional regulator n=1 Tax=Mangrovitalea sediminis TaxID=1982043 RepID=UPI001D0D313D|nr:AraC family transcriptional regulator [Mangrovitalea sediminis]